MNEKIIWDHLYSKIQNPYGVAALMGNLYVESGLIPNNLQNTYNKKLGMTDTEYTNAVDNKTYTNFIYDSAGYGLAQWTYYSRKANLLKYAQENNKSIGDLEMQLEFLLKELQAYSVCYQALIGAKSIREASDVLVTKYEKPSDQSENGKQNRANYGQKYYDMFAEVKRSEKPMAEEPLYRAVVIADSGRTVRMRKSPSTSASVLYEIPLGTNIEVMDLLDGWSQIIYKGQTGYMMSKFLKPEGSEETQKETQKEEQRNIKDEIAEMLKTVKKRLNEALEIINEIERKIN